MKRDPDFCPTHWLVYSAASNESTAFVPGSATTTRVADDITLPEDGSGPRPIACELSAVELGMIGKSGPFEADVDLRWPSLDDVVDGTQRTFIGSGDGKLEVTRFLFEPGVFIEPDDQPLYVTWLPDSPRTGVPNVERTYQGSSSASFAVLDTTAGSSGQWVWHTIPDSEAAIFHISVFCRGDAPTGACCMPHFTANGWEPVCIERANAALCVAGRWVPDMTCADADFDPPCGSATCCLPDATCENLTRDECDQVGGYWWKKSFCGDYGQQCVWGCLLGCRVERVQLRWISAGLQ